MSAEDGFVQCEHQPHTSHSISSHAVQRDTDRADLVICGLWMLARKEAKLQGTKPKPKSKPEKKDPKKKRPKYAVEAMDNTLGARSVPMFTSQNSMAAYSYDVRNSLLIANAPDEKAAMGLLRQALEFDLFNINVDAVKFISQIDNIMEEAAQHGDAFNY